MVGAARLEQLILEAIAVISEDDWAQYSITTLQMRIGSLDAEATGATLTTLVDAIIALEMSGLILIQKYKGSNPIVVPYSRAESHKETYKSVYFSHGSFQLKLTHEGRKALESIQPARKVSEMPAAEIEGKLPQDPYCFHPDIEKVSGKLYRNGHFKQAALEAYIRVIEEVKRRSRIADDGDSLMNHVFACDKKTPVIQFNSLQTDAERDEQKGLMFLFKGIVGLRNYKAHSNTLFDDPYRAHDYLALASLLLRLLEIAKVNPAP